MVSDDKDIPEIVFKMLSSYFEKKLGKRFSYEMFQSMLRLREIPQDTLNNELINFQLDIKKYRSGVFFWVNESYPNVILLYSLLGVNITNLQIQPDMKEIIEEYYSFMEDVRKKNPYVLNAEMNESKMFFNGEIEPIHLTTKDLLINSLYSRIIKINDEISPQIKIYAEKIRLFFNVNCVFCSEQFCGCIYQYRFNLLLV